MEQLGGKVGVVTGAASGIGRAMAERLAAEGMKVVLADVEEGALDVAAKELSEGGATVLAVPTDVSKGDQVDALAERTVSEFGGVHLVHNNAGVATGGLMWELDAKDWEWVLGVNLWGVIHGVRAFVPRIIEAGGGHVVNTASMAGLTSAPMMGPYNVSKHGVVALSEGLYKELELAGHDVGVSVLCPGWVNTGIAESDRNRPAELQADREPATGDEGVRAMLSSMLQTGMPPSEVADHVLQAVRERRFYVLTHPWQDMIEQRMRDILEGRNPTPSMFPV